MSEYKINYSHLLTAWRTSPLIEAAANTLQQYAYLKHIPLKELSQEFVQKPANALFLASLAQFAGAIPAFAMADQISDPIASAATKVVGALLTASGIKTYSTSAKLRSAHKQSTTREMDNVSVHAADYFQPLSPEADKAFKDVKENIAFIEFLNTTWLLYGGFTNNANGDPALEGYSLQNNISFKRVCDISFILLLVEDHLRDDVGIADSKMRKEILKQIKYDYFMTQSTREELKAEHEQFLAQFNDGPGYLTPTGERDEVKAPPVAKASQPKIVKEIPVMQAVKQEPPNVQVTPAVIQKETKIAPPRVTSPVAVVAARPDQTQQRQPSHKTLFDLLAGAITVHPGQEGQKPKKALNTKRETGKNNPPDLLQQIFVYGDQKHDKDFEKVSTALYWLINNPRADEATQDILNQLHAIFDVDGIVKLNDTKDTSVAHTRLYVNWETIARSQKIDIISHNKQRLPEIKKQVAEIIESIKLLNTGNDNFNLGLLSDADWQVLSCALIRDFCFPPGDTPNFKNILPKLEQVTPLNQQAGNISKERTGQLSNNDNANLLILWYFFITAGATDLAAADLFLHGFPKEGTPAAAALLGVVGIALARMTQISKPEYKANV